MLVGHNGWIHPFNNNELSSIHMPYKPSCRKRHMDRKKAIWWLTMEKPSPEKEVFDFYKPGMMVFYMIEAIFLRPHIQVLYRSFRVRGA
jgi:hypothetical protein